MAEETKIGIKLEEETKPIKKMCEKLMDSVNHELDKGIENVDTKELGEAIDMIKDLYEAKKEMYEACYYKQIMEAMEEHDFEDEEEIMDEGRRGYRGQRRDSRGRYMSRRGYESPMMHDEMREMDYMDGRMYYGGSTGGGSGSSMGGSSSSMGSGNRGYSEGGQMSSRMQRDGREGRSGEARRGYIESKETGKEKSEKMRELETYMKSMAEDLTEAIEGATPEERALAKNKLSALVQKM